MKKLLTAFAFLLLALTARGQVFIINDNMMVGRLSTIRATVLDSLSNEPVAYASVYVIPSKDTAITNFTLTDDKGQARLDEVPFGSYSFHVEMMGYKPFVKERYFRDRMVDMGTIRLQQDPQFLQAAVVSDVGNPIVIKKDTVEFTAASYRVGANDMLKDLLKRMPGMEITDNGTVRFNGKAIDKLTVNGRTFFFDDQSTALNNLPAAVVDKIRVIDRENETARATGVQSATREQVLDVGLKKEYEKGWFGNAGFHAGTTLGSKETADDPLRDNRGLLYSGNALVSAYSDKDQLTVIGNAQNVDATNAVVFVVMDGSAGFGGTDVSGAGGLSTAAQLGVNANTSRIRDVETTAAVNYKYGDTQTGTRSERTTYQADGNLVSNQDNSGRNYQHSLGANLEFRKEKGKVWFHIRPNFNYSLSDATSAGTSETFRSQVKVNSSDRLSHSLNVNKVAGLSADATLRDMGGKRGRSFRVGTTASYSANTSDSEENSTLVFAGGEDVRALTYDGGGHSFSNNTTLTWSEPFGDKWTLSANLSLNLSKTDNARDAFDAAGKNEYYSSVSRNTYFRHQYGLTTQYKITQQTWLTLGGSAACVLNETFSKSYGTETSTGKGAWDWLFSPELSFTYFKGNQRLSFMASGTNTKPSNSLMLPLLNIGNLSSMSLGNVNLKSSVNTLLFGTWSVSNPQRFSSLMVTLTGNVLMNTVGYARWYDTNGVLYSIPVNVGRPGLSSSLRASYTTPLDAKRVWTLTLAASASYSSSASYQAAGTLQALDKDHFNYSAFMADFWGDAAGDRFYGGKSGFRESVTRTLSPSADVNLRYNQLRYSFRAGASVSGQMGRYSLDPSADMNTLMARFFAEGSYTTRHEFEFKTDLSYRLYRGYAQGFNQPELQWNAEISKNVGAFNLSLKARDIFNQTRNLNRTITANYQEDSYRLIMGRYFLFGVKWNFGKMNASHSGRAQRAAMDMVF